MLIKKKFFVIILSSLFLCVILSCSPVFAQDSNTATERLYGSDRYETSVAISTAGWVHSNTVIIASGLNYPDALSASALAKVKDAPILLTDTDALEPSIIAEIKRLNATQAIIIGGTGIIGTGIEEQLTGLGISITRIGGTDRYDTSEKVAEIVGVKNGIIVSSALNFPDALSIAPIAGIMAMPILISPEHSLNENIAAFIKGKSIPVSYLVGGTGVLDSTIDSSLPNSKRISGDDRYATNLSVNNQFSGNLNFNTIYLASGNDFPDALCGAALAAKNDAPIFLTDKDSISEATINFIKSKNVQHVVILGGNGSVSQNLQNTVDAIISTSNVVQPASVSLDKTTDTLTVGGTDTLTSTVTPDNATNKAVTWTSSNNAIATVDATGNVTAVSPGTATIIATTADGGTTASCTVTVNNPIVEATSVSLDKTTDTLTVGGTDTLTSTVTPDNATNKAVTWTSSNNAIATVDATGNVTAVSPGAATIIATTTDGGTTASCTITVFNPGPGHMLISELLVNFTASYEGYSAIPYGGADSQNSTIGYGHVILPGEKYSNLTEQQAWNLLMKDLQSTANGVNSFTDSLTLSQQQFDALVDFAYNCGVNALQESTLFNDISAGASADTLKTDFQIWSYCNGTPLIGLYRRRIDEWQIYTSGDYTRDYPTAPAGYV
ncbi:cell wall-binding repeat-containing protein [Clostridium sp. WILCCON 0269]|uniref:Lysozyme n=1 Tax=Candidatus Clostridium eludens TaxID=3381663 RepID=A0ABW8SXW0_9CLOT